jgi:hypothetical protein
VTLPLSFQYEKKKPLCVPVEFGRDGPVGLRVRDAVVAMLRASTAAQAPPISSRARPRRFGGRGNHSCAHPFREDGRP